MHGYGYEVRIVICASYTSQSQSSTRPVSSLIFCRLFLTNLFLTRRVRPCHTVSFFLIQVYKMPILSTLRYKKSAIETGKFPMQYEYDMAGHLQPRILLLSQIRGQLEILMRADADSHTTDKTGLRYEFFCHDARAPRRTICVTLT